MGKINKKGKCYSKVNRGQRIKLDDYNTPLSMVRQFLEVEMFDSAGSFLEPASGGGAIVRVLQERGYKNVTAYDIKMTPSNVSFVDSQYNFFNESRKFDYVITNPPYRRATNFIRKAATVCLEKFALLMPLLYLHGVERYAVIYKNDVFPFGLKQLWVFTRMPMLTAELREDGMYNTGMQAYAWYLFAKGYAKKPTIDWIDNNAYVIRGEKKSG